MTRVLHVLPSLSQKYGGPVRAVVDLSARSAALGLDSEIAGFGPLDLPDNPFDERRIHSFPIKAPAKYCYSPQFRTWLAANLSNFNGVVVHGLWIYPNWAVFRECSSKGIPYACFLHGMLEPRAAYSPDLWKTLKKAVCWKLRERAILQQARRLFFTTKRERAVVQKVFHLETDGCIMPVYGIEAQRGEVPAPLDPKLALPPEWRIALFLGRLHAKKNIEFLIRAWEAARPPECWHFVIAGAGDNFYERRLKQLVYRLRLDHRVHFAGFVSGRDKSYLLQRADWFLLPSLRENFGVAVLEAVGNGCAVAISDQVYVAESLHPNSEVLPLDVGAWTSFIRERMVDIDWRSSVAAINAEFVARNLGMDVVSRKWAETLSETFRVQP